MILAERPADPRQSLGRRGERAAERVLRRAGMRILHRRFRLRIGEIDLIAAQGQRIVFVEVKTRRGRGYGFPAEAVNRRKRERMAQIAAVYLQRRGWSGRPCRFDVVQVFVEADGSERVDHIEDAFRIWPSG